MLGDDIPFNYTYQGVQYTGHFIYNGSETGSWSTGANIESNTIAGSVNVFNTYQVVRYLFQSPFSGNVTLNDVDISINMNFAGGGRGGFLAGGMGTANISDPKTTFNLISNGRSYCASFDALSCNSQADSSLADYYNLVQVNYYSKQMRSILYDDINFSVNHVYFNNLRTSSFGTLSGTYSMLYVMCPYTYGNFSVSTQDQTTTVPPTTDINVSVYVDNSAIESQLDQYLGADDTRITTYETINLGTFPTFDYNNATETVNVSQVISQTSDGINSIWYIISGLFGSAPVLVWLVPFCIFMSILSFVLWRKGG